MTLYTFTDGNMLTTQLDHMLELAVLQRQVKHARKLTRQAVCRIARSGKSKYKAIIPAVDTTNGPEIVYVGIR